MRLTSRAWRSRHIGRLAIQVGAAFALAMIAAGLITFAVADRWVSNRVDRLLERHSAKYLHPIDGHPVTAAGLAAKIRDWERRKVMSERTYLLFDNNGRRIAGRLNIAVPPDGMSDVEYFGGGRHQQMGRALTAQLPDGSRFVVVQQRAAAAGLNALIPVVVVVISLVSLAMGVSATLVFVNLTARRLAKTQETADAIAAGDLSRRVPTDGLDGIFAVQASSLNRMLDRMEELVRAQRLFSSNLAHDLRTPLTRLRSLLAEGAVDGAPRFATMFERAERECVSIIAIFDALLRLAEIESGRHPSAMNPLSLRPLVEDVVDTMEPVIADHGGRLQVERLDDVTIHGDANLIGQLLVNLLENVATHTPSGTVARLALTRDRDGATITVRDDGPGLIPTDLARVTEPFARGSQPSLANGNGLGLAIVKAIARFHGGKLSLADARPGLLVRISLPMPAPADAVRDGSMTPTF